MDNLIYNNIFRFISDSYYSKGGYTSIKHYSYLDKFDRESNEGYNNRIRQSYLTNIFQPLIDLYLEPIYSVKKEIKTSNNELNNIVFNTNMYSKSYDILLDYKLYDLCFYTVESDINKKYLPIITKIDPQFIELVKYNGNKITYIKYKIFKYLNNTKITVTCEYNINNYIGIFSKYTTAYIDDDGTIHTNNTGDYERLTYFDETTIGYVLHEGAYELDIIPKSFNLASLQCEIFNKESNRDTILRNTAFPILCIQTDSDIRQLSLSSSSILKVPTSATNMPSYLEPSKDNLEIHNTVIDNLYSKAYKLFTNNLLSDNVKYTTATSSAIASNSFNNNVNNLYYVYKNILDKLIISVINIYSINTNYTIEYDELNLNFEEVNNTVKDITNNNNP